MSSSIFIIELDILFMRNIEVLIIPDVHGRTFWKDAIAKFPKEEFPNLQIIFLGDYLDPYTGYEPITKEQAFENFQEIIDLKYEDPRVTLLIGNHDWHYFVNLDTCRMDHAREKDIEILFTRNMPIFRLHKIIELDGCKYLFTHAGISQNWLNNIASMAKDEFNKWDPGTLSPTNIVDNQTIQDYKWIKAMSHINETFDFELLEQALHQFDNSFYTCSISMISRDRGGWFPYGSLIWADVHEHLYNEDLKGFYQIFGHTMTYPSGQKDYAISPRGHCWAMLDASQAFVLDTEGNIEPIGELI